MPLSLDPLVTKCVAASLAFLCPLAVAFGAGKLQLATSAAALPRPEKMSIQAEPALLPSAASTRQADVLAVEKSATPKERIVSGPYAGPPPITQQQILDIARSALGVRYVWGGESWDALDKNFKGVDCSGLVAKAWQVPRASETFQEVFRRPTTETLNLPNPHWFEVEMADRQAGDILVRYDKAVQHVFMFESNAPDYAISHKVWVFEASAPEVKRTTYTIEALTNYSAFRRTNIDDIGIVGRSRNWLFGEFVATFRAFGGERYVGRPTDLGEGRLVHRTPNNQGYAQDFANGELGSGVMQRADVRAGAFLVSGAIYKAYLERGAEAGELGFAVANAQGFALDCGTVTRQAFEHGVLTLNCDGASVVTASPAGG
jgi:cell wall-associated NlpC family hydrolase